MNNFKMTNDLTKFAICAVGIATGRYEQEVVNDELLQEEAEKYAERRLKDITRDEMLDAQEAITLLEFADKHYKPMTMYHDALKSLYRSHYYDDWVQEYLNKGD